MKIIRTASDDFKDRKGSEEDRRRPTQRNGMKDKESLVGYEIEQKKGNVYLA